MSIIWADFPSGQRGLYGTDFNRLFDGIWVALEGAFAGSFTALVGDPDPVIGANGVVLGFFQSTSTGGYSAIYLRFTSKTAQTTAGMAFRLWMSGYPVGDTARGGAMWEFRSASNVLIARFVVGASGQIRAFRADGTFVGESPPAAITANAYNHIETKIVRDAAAGTLEVRVNGGVKLTLNALALGVNDVINYALGQDSNTDQGNARFCYFKDVVFWDGSGTYGNTFQGSVAVYDLYADADVSLNWTPSIGAAGWPLITDNFPANTLTASGAISDGEVVRIDNTYYRLSSGSLDTGAPAGTAGNPWKVLIGGSVAATLLNLYKAIGATGVAGTDYSTALTAHATVNANGVTATALSVTAKLQTAAAIVTSETGANLAWVSGTLVDGPTDPSYIYAPFPAPAAAVFSMTNLPVDVTSIRALLPIFRAQKSDGGDCNVQAGLSPDNATWVSGTDQPLTTAFTYWWSAIHTNPVTAAPWTPGQVNNAYVRVNRTL